MSLCMACPPNIFRFSEAKRMPLRSQRTRPLLRGVTGHEIKVRFAPLAPFNERGRVERGAECCDAFRKFFPRPAHTLLRFVGDDSAGHRHENSFLKKAERPARAEERAESNRLNPAEKRPRESAFPRARALRMFRSR